MKKLILFLIASLFFANFAEARIGETIPTLEKRFGKGTLLMKMYINPPFTAIYDFKKNDIRIRAYFIGDKCDMISYSAKPGQYFKSEERKRLLAINKQGFIWVKTDKPQRFDGKDKVAKPNESWKRSCGKVFAYNFSNLTICIQTQRYLDKQKALDKKIATEKLKKEKHKLDGF